MTSTTRLRPLSTKPFIPYVRVSRIGGRSGEGYISKPEQMRTNHGVAKEYDVELTKPFEDEDYSGGNTERPDFQKALAEIRAGRAGGIVTANLDRFSRNPEDGLRLIREIEALGGAVLTGEGPASLSNGDDAFITTIRFAMGAKVLSGQKDGFTKSVRNAIERGIHLSAPFGYAKGEDKRLIENTHESPAVCRAFEMRANGHSWNAVAQELNRMGIMPRPYKRHGETRQTVWTHKAIRQLVKNEVYLGIAYNGDHRTPGAHKALVTPELYAAANRAKGTKPAKPSEGYLLSGLVRCASCGYVMVHYKQGGHRYYACRMAKGSGACPGPAMARAEDLEAEVTERFEREFLDLEVKAVATDADVVAAETRAHDAELALSTALDRFASLGEMSEAETRVVEGNLDRARATLRQAELELNEARLAARGIDLPADLNADGFGTATIPERRHWLSLVFACVVVWPSARWRQPVTERFRAVSRDDAPSNSTALIPFVAGLDR